MASLNRVEIIGYLGADPDIRVMPNGESVANFSVATSKSWVDKITQEKKEKTTWHRIVLFRSLADVAGKYLKKGFLVRIEGELIYRTYTDQQNIERTITEIHGSHLLMLSKSGDTQRVVIPAAGEAHNGAVLAEDGDIPF
ncbi:single-stranded DNA-binding protein [Ursidibacter arcticus]